MRSPVDYGTSAGVWAQDKWKGKFDVDWLFVKDVPNSQLRHIRLENNDNKPVTNSRDTQEVPLEKAKQVLKIIATYKHTTSIFGWLLTLRETAGGGRGGKKGNLLF